MNRPWMRIGLASLVLASGCGGFQIPEPRAGAVAFLTQTYPLDEVLDRARDLREGMEKRQVLALLGKPSFIDSRGWDYVSHDISGTPVYGPQCYRLRVSFASGAYVSNELMRAPRAESPAGGTK